MRRSISAALAVLAISGALRAEQAAALKVDVVKPLDRVSVDGARFAVVSNTERILLRISFTGEPKSPGSTSPVPVYEITATHLPDGEKVPIRQWPQGFGARGNERVIELLVEVPIAAEQRQQIVERYVDSEIASSTGQIQEALRAQRSNAIAALQSVFVQNRTGDYAIKVRLADPRWPAGGGEVRVRIADKGTFANVLRARPNKDRR
jgi:hypothetical protein